MTLSTEGMGWLLFPSQIWTLGLYKINKTVCLHEYVFSFRVLAV